MRTNSLRLLLAASVMTFAFRAYSEETVKPTVEDTSTQKREAVVNQRQENQEKRIKEGVSNGSLTTKEVEKLEKKEAKIEKMEQKALADGKMDKKEFKKIEKAQNRVSKEISKKKHNKQ